METFSKRSPQPGGRAVAGRPSDEPRRPVRPGAPSAGPSLVAVAARAGVA